MVRHETGCRVESFGHDSGSPKRTVSSLKIGCQAQMFVDDVRMIFREEVRHCMEVCGNRVRDQKAIALLFKVLCYVVSGGR